jgi:hypothetical protein
MVVFHPEFVKGTYDINFVAKHYLVPDSKLDKHESSAIAASFVSDGSIGPKGSESTVCKVRQSKWKQRDRDE